MGFPQRELCFKEIEADGGEDFIFALVREGMIPRKIMQRYTMGPRYFYRWLDEKGAPPGRRDRWRLAKQDSADALLDQADALLENVDYETGAALEEPDSNEKVRLIMALADHKKWLASMYNKERYGASPAIQINQNFSLGSVHLSTLREFGSFQKVGTPLPVAKVLEETPNGASPAPPPVAVARAGAGLSAEIPADDWDRTLAMLRAG